jgi:hypothetical protein
MRVAWIAGSEALRLRLNQPEQVADDQPEAAMPPYMESFLAHLRLLVGVPFEHLVPDARLLPIESIRFFYLDRSWADRLVDGAVAVGKIGTREQAHHQAHEPAIRRQLDVTERIVRPIQQGRGSFPVLKQGNDNNLDTNGPAQIVTGFLLRSAAVSGWPHMDVRAYDETISEPFDPSTPEALSHQLVTLRLERLAPAVMISLFQGIPQLVILEEPHHGIQFGVKPGGFLGFEIFRRQADGEQVQPVATDLVFVRQANRSVLHIAGLRRALAADRQANPAMPDQKGGASFAVEVLNPPWRQRFEGVTDHGQGGQGGGSFGFVASVPVAVRVTGEDTLAAVRELVSQGG